MARERMIPFDLVCASFLGLLGAYSGSVLFGFVDEKGPELGGFYLVTAAIGTVVLAVVLVTGTLRREKDSKGIATIEDPKISHFLFHDPRAGVL